MNFTIWESGISEDKNDFLKHAFKYLSYKPKSLFIFNARLLHRCTTSKNPGSNTPKSSISITKYSLS